MRFNRRLIRTYMAVVAVASLALPAAAQNSDTRSTARVDLSTIGIDNFGRIDAEYFRGGQPKGHDYADLAALGVRTVINLTGDDASAAEKTMVEATGMKYVQIAMTTHETPTAAKIAQFLKIVDDPASEPVYVHCVGGRHRTGVMTAVYRMTNDGWSADQAFAEMKRFKFGADFLHSEFKQFVYAYGANLAAAAAAPASANAKVGG